MTRDEWCTPRWLTDALGWYEVDPCSNSRSHLLADVMLSLEQGRDGLAEASSWPTEAKSFINPPYSRGRVFRWVEAWRHTDYTFLLRWDPSTRWHQRLMQNCQTVWFPNQRINFEPPPGVTASSNPFPHALFFRKKVEEIPHERRIALHELGRFYEPLR